MSKKSKIRCGGLIYLMSFVLVLAVTGTASADQWPITVPDAGFDDHVLNNVGDWIDIADSGYTGAWKSHSGDTWIAWNYYGDDLPALSGNNTAYGYEDYIYQILDEKFIEGRTYTLSVWVGQAWDGYADGWWLYFTGEDYTNNLIEASGNGPVGSWGQVSLVYTATAADAGKKIGIKMYGDLYVTFEDVTLSYYYDPALASNPNPANKQTDVLRDVVLSWTPGAFVGALSPKHKVFFSENFDDVNDGVGGVTQDANSYTPAQRLDFGTTYYWKVDEANSTTGWDEGDIWQFTTELLAYPIENITATASSVFKADTGPENTINGLGLDVNDLHSMQSADMWLSSNEEPNGAWIEYELDKVHKLHEMWVWNSNQMMESALGFGLKDVTIEYSTNGTDYTTLAGVPEFAQALETPDYAHNTTVDFSGAAAKYVRLTANSNWGDDMDRYGLSEVRFFSIPVFAREPSPDVGATDVAVDVTLGFRAGREAAEHNVYLNSDEQVVIDGNVPVSTMAETSFGPLSLELGTTYYWKINEVNMAETPTTWQGDIWNFTTPDFLVVDDFESYNDIDPPDLGSNRIFEAWPDGYDDPTNGALIGNDLPPYAEQNIVHSGNQAMPYFYDNSGTATYSEATRDFAVPQDWTKASVQTLALYFYGTAGNTGQLYVRVNGFKVVYDGDASNLALAGWQAWNIELASFDTNLQSVTTLAIGIDDNGASGTLYFDDFRLYARSPEFITPAEPNNAGLVMHLGFDEGFGTVAGDLSGNGNDGTLNGGPQWVAGMIGGALEFDGTDDYVSTDKSLLNNLSEFTLACWINAINYTSNRIGIVGQNDLVEFGFNDDGNLVCWISGLGDHTIAYPYTYPSWHHVAVVGTAGGTILYIDGQEVVGPGTAPSDNYGSSTYTVNIGGGGIWGASGDWFQGQIDDVRIYNRALSGAEAAWLGGRTEPFDKPF